MDLALLVYAISLLGPMSSAMTFVCVTSAIVLTICLLVSLLSADCSDGPTIWAFTKPKIKWLILVFVLAGTVQVLIPKEKTAYMMVGAYTAQKIAQDPKVEQVGTKVMTILNQKLDSYIEDGVDEAEKSAKKKLAKEAAK